MNLFNRSKRIDGWRAISFRGDQVRAAHVMRGSSGRPAVYMVTSAPLNGAGPVAALGHLSRQWQGERFQCATLVNLGEYQFLPVEAPNVPATELKSAIFWLVKDMLDFHVDEATIDVLAIPQEGTAAQRGRAMYAVAARSKVIAEHQHWFEAAKIPLSVIDIPEMAQRNVASLLETPGRGVALASFDDDGGLLTFTAGGELYLARKIDVNLGQLLNSAPDERETYHERVALEIQRSLDHFGRQFSAISIGRLVVAPVGEDDGGLVAYLSANLDTSVEQITLDSIFDISRVPELKSLVSQQRYFMVLGAALRVEESAL